jgi:2-polyprenyl-3-methyl-5-hydroxy-6-metoxy-1,4-benzoquinol methylase
MSRQAPLQANGEPVACALCGETHTKTLYVKLGYAIGRCIRCGLVYANPRAPRDLILSRYSREYFWDEYLPSQGVVDGQFDLNYFDVRNRAILDMIGARTTGRRLLEVGIGAGFFLKSAERAGWQVQGIELSEEATRFATDRLGLSIRCEYAESALVEPGSFDAAIISDVVEHLFDPGAVLSAMSRALAPGGTLVLTTPNFDAASRHLLGADWAVLSPTEHLYYFTEESLTRLLRASGFTNVQFERGYVMWGEEETINFRHTHAPDGIRAKITERVVRVGGRPLARLLQHHGWQDRLLCFAQKTHGLAAAP